MGINNGVRGNGGVGSATVRKGSEAPPVEDFVCMPKRVRFAKGTGEVLDLKNLRIK